MPITIIGPELTWLWTKIVLKRGLCNRSEWARLLRYRRLVVCTIATSTGREFSASLRAQKTSGSATRSRQSPFDCLGGSRFCFEFEGVEISDLLRRPTNCALECQRVLLQPE